jgi:hypothetical protein
MISPSGAKGLRSGHKIKTQNGTYTITGFGSQTNATKDFEATDEKGKKFNLRVSLRGARGIQVAPAPSLNFPEKEEMLESIISKSIGSKKYQSSNQIVEAINVNYWKGYHERSTKITGGNKVASAVENEVINWNKNNTDGPSNNISSNGEKKVMNLAHDFFKSAGWISSDIIQAMITQEG